MQGLSRYRCTVEMTVHVDAPGDLEAQEQAFALVVRDLTPADFWIERAVPKEEVRNGDRNG